MRKLVFWGIISGIFLFNGCAKKIPISYDNLQVGNYTYLMLTSGENVKGEIQSKDEGKIAINTMDQLRGIAKSDIVSIRKKPEVYDEMNRIVLESEIQREKNSKNMWLFTLGGGALSFGVSFFVTANILHQSSEEANGAALWGPTAGATALGSLLFGIQGNKLDRKYAIESVREQRKINALKEMKNTKRKRKAVEKQINDVKEDRERQNEEINKLLKKINEKKSKKD